MKIQISKDFYDPPVGGVFPPRVIDFVQIAPDPQTVPRLIIVDETISNLTGVPWTDYHWALLDQGDAWFNVPLSMGFDVSPFTNKAFSDPANIFNDPNKATDLFADGGIIPPFGTFWPGHAGGELVIDIDLSALAPTPGPISHSGSACHLPGIVVRTCASPCAAPLPPGRRRVMPVSPTRMLAGPTMAIPLPWPTSPCRSPCCEIVALRRLSPPSLPTALPLAHRVDEATARRTDRC